MFYDYYSSCTIIIPVFLKPGLHYYEKLSYPILKSKKSHQGHLQELLSFLHKPAQQLLSCNFLKFSREVLCPVQLIFQHLKKATAFLTPFVICNLNTYIHKVLEKCRFYLSSKVILSPWN